MGRWPVAACKLSWWSERLRSTQAPSRAPDIYIRLERNAVRLSQAPAATANGFPESVPA
jgi:hypothetical protein